MYYFLAILTYLPRARRERCFKPADNLIFWTISTPFSSPSRRYQGEKIPLRDVFGVNINGLIGTSMDYWAIKTWSNLICTSITELPHCRPVQKFNLAWWLPKMFEGCATNRSKQPQKRRKVKVTDRVGYCQDLSGKTAQGTEWTPRLRRGPVRRKR